ncbi:hypothetical protein AWC17_15675 [Mycobacterium nebraskense]|uniref:PPE family protein n=1 Tax=Mycobacterium nebraskense TaxID=244292 RepID=A0A1X1YYK7_9MYCO|nr:PPE family protein [Mycobacterium nebraskense]MCV7117758.1 PPE family protein [Mycobacterium nebraskense]ORW16162.1 hypothetical protein AWC17_15675 [Mycobacterium nebraskense]
MDFGALPPEINSARMYFGPGAGPLLAAAASWDGLAAEVRCAATSYTSVLSSLAGGPWLGPACAAMVTAAAPYVAWLNSTAAHAEQTAAQSRAAAGAYEAAFAMTVPPPVIAANRALLMSLIATNILGQNTPAIAATEAHYGEMWAQDGAAMYGYAASSAAAASLTPFTPPQPSTNPAGVAAQGTAIAQTAGTSAATNTQAVLSQVISAVPGALQQLASPMSPPSSTSSLPSLSSALNSVNPALSSTSQVAWISAGLMSNASKMQELMPAVSSATTASGSGLAGSLASDLAGGLGSGTLGSAGLNASAAGGSGAAVSAGLGRATSIGALSIPQSWAAATPTISPAATVLSGTGLGAVPDAAGGPGGMLGGVPLGAGGAGRGGATGLVPDARFLQRPPMLPSWPTV